MYYCVNVWWAGGGVHYCVNMWWSALLCECVVT